MNLSTVRPTDACSRRTSVPRRRSQPARVPEPHDVGDEKAHEQSERGVRVPAEIPAPEVEKNRQVDKTLAVGDGVLRERGDHVSPPGVHAPNDEGQVHDPECSQDGESEAQHNTRRAGVAELLRIRARQIPSTRNKAMSQTICSTAHAESEADSPGQVTSGQSTRATDLGPVPVDSYFEQYAQELAEDIGAVQKEATWPNQYIDWEAAADALKQDYMRVTYGETEYWIRT